MGRNKAEYTPYSLWKICLQNAKFLMLATEWVRLTQKGRKRGQKSFIFHNLRFFNYSHIPQLLNYSPVQNAALGSSSSILVKDILTIVTLNLLSLFSALFAVIYCLRLLNPVSSLIYLF